MQPGWSHPQHSRQAEAPEPAQTQLPAKPLLSQPTMERRAEINRFAIFLFCLLVPLGSLAPTETSESKVTTGQRQKRFTTDVPSKSAAIQGEAHDLFEFYQKCVNATFHTEAWMIRSEAINRMETILNCSAFHANCCVLHHIRNILKSLESDIESFCTNSSKNVVTANLNQLNTTLIQGTAFYTCRVQELPQTQTMGWAEKKTYIWWFLKRYEDIMQTEVNRYFRAAV